MQRVRAATEKRLTTEATEIGEFLPFAPPRVGMTTFAKDFQHLVNFQYPVKWVGGTRRLAGCWKVGRSVGLLLTAYCLLHTCCILAPDFCSHTRLQYK